jgi:hypothetical protein
LPEITLNHFDYFTEIENAFVRRRGRHLLLSPVDWALIEEWEKEGIPLKIVLATIDDIFDQVEADPKRSGSVRTLSYCKNAVESRYRSWMESQVGGGKPSKFNAPENGSEEPALAAPGERIELSETAVRLESIASGSTGAFRTALEDAAARLRELASAGTADDAVEEELESLDEAIDEAILANTGERDMKALREKVAAEIGPRPAAMDEETYSRTESLLVRKRLREASGIPRLGLFYL